MADITAQVFAGTDVGLEREHNEDAFIVAALTPGVTATAEPSDTVEETLSVDDHGLLFVVADGMGGAAGGEVASSMATEILQQEMVAYERTADPRDTTSFVSALERAAVLANTRIHQFASEHVEYRGMGTTATIVGVLGSTLYLAQVGDSRAYLVRGGRAWQLTKDQSLMQRLIDAGEITVEEAELSERRNIILQALGPDSTVNIDVTYQPLRRNDLLIMCTDGLSGVLRDDEIARTALETPVVAEIGSQLIAMANAAGGPDNITVIVARFDGSDLAEANATDPVGHYPFPLPNGDKAPLSIAVVTDPSNAITQELITIAVSPPAPAPPPFLRAAVWLVVAVAALIALVLLQHR